MLTLQRIRCAKIVPLARESGVPRNKLYSILGDLEEIGVVQRVSEKPIAYSTRPGALADLAAQRMAAIASIRDKIPPGA